MSWLLRMLPWSKAPDEVAREHLAAGRFEEAWVALEGTDQHERLREGILHDWLNTAVMAAQEGRGDEARATLARVRERAGADPEVARRLEATRWQVRELELCSRLDPTWAKLVTAAGVQSRRFHGPRATRPAPRHSLFAERALVKAVKEHAPPELQKAPDGNQVAALSEDALEVLSPTVGAGYPEDLWTLSDEQRPYLVRGALFIAAARPDLAVIPLLEAPGEHALLRFELARVSHALGYPKNARAALAEFAELAGGHRAMRGLHTAVFLAQLQAAAKEAEAALALIESADCEITGSTSILYAKLLIEVGRLDDAERVIGDPQDDSARQELLDKIAALRQGQEQGADA